MIQTAGQQMAAGLSGKESFYLETLVEKRTAPQSTTRLPEYDGKGGRTTLADRSRGSLLRKRSSGLGAR